MKQMTDELKKVADDAGLDPDVVEYLQARRATSVGIVAAFASGFEEADRLLMDPLEKGFKHEAKEFKVDDAQKAIARASLRFLWKLCREQTQPSPTSNRSPRQHKPRPPPSRCSRRFRPTSCGL